MGTDELAREFIETLYPVAEYAAYVLNKDCAEALALEPLGKFPDTATYAARSMATAPSSYIRCVACLVPLFTPDCDPDLLWELWENETQKRDNPPDSIREELEAARANPEAFGLPPDHANEEPSQPIEEQVSFIAGLEANSVAERIIMSAIAFLDRTDEHKQAAWRVLQDMVQRACDGVDWNDAHFALALLVRSEHPEAPTLLSRCAALDDDGHLATWARRIAAGERSLLDEPLKLLGPVPAGVELPEEQRAELDAMVDAARRVEESLD